jgi:hypothetical protein
MTAKSANHYAAHNSVTSKQRGASLVEYAILLTPVVLVFGGLVLLLKLFLSA